MTSTHLASALATIPGPDDRGGAPVTLLGYGAATAVVAAAGAQFAPAGGRPGATWYRSLDKPPFTPPNALFGPVWTALYALSAASATRVRRAEDPSGGFERNRALRWWWTQTALNGAWTPLFFGARKPKLALADLAALLVALAAYTRSAAKIDRPAAALITPYLAWTAFAGALNAEIVRRNR